MDEVAGDVLRRISFYSNFMFTEFQGFVGEKHEKPIRLFRSDLLDEINRQYGIAEYLPDYLLIGSDTALEGIFVAPDGQVVLIPFIPLSARHAQKFFGSVAEFRAEFERTFRADTSYPPHLTRIAVHPIALGGSPTDPANIKDASEAIHVETTVYWNKVYADVLRRQNGGA